MSTGSLPSIRVRPNLLPMIRQMIRAATFQRDAYLRAVIGTNGTGDAVIIVVAVYFVLSVVVSGYGALDVIGHARFILNGAFAWLILAGVIYLVSRHLLGGDGSFQGVLAMAALAHPVLLLLVAAQIGTAPPLTLLEHPTLLVLAIGRLDLIPIIVVLVATAWFLAILAASTRVAMSLPMDRAAMAVGGGYAAWWMIDSIFRF